MKREDIKKRWYNLDTLDNLVCLGLYKYVLRGALTKKGRKLWASTCVLKVFSELKRSEKYDPTITFLVAFLKISPKVKLNSLKLGAKIHKIPLPIDFKHQVTFAVKWLVSFIRNARRPVTAFELSDLLLLALEDKGEICYKKRQIYQIAINNRYLVAKYFK